MLVGAEIVSNLAAFASFIAAVWPTSLSAVSGELSWLGFQPDFVATAACLTAAYLTLAVSERSAALARVAGAMATGLAFVTAGWLASERPDLWPLISLCVAFSGLGLAVVGGWGRRRVAATNASSSWAPFAEGLPDMAFAASALAFLLCFVSPGLDSRWPTYTAAVLAATAFQMAWLYRASALAWIGSTLVLGGLLHALVHRGTFANPWSVALLTHASLAAFLNLLVALWTSKQPRPRRNRTKPWLPPPRTQRRRSRYTGFVRLSPIQLAPPASLLRCWPCRSCCGKAGEAR